ncbi:MAG: 23S rRNA (pseudouridine(1915)-N(3))-methyltransferase RlmH [bacterium]
MTNIHLIVLGKLKESYWREAETEYLKRLSPFADIQIHELREESFDEKTKPELVKEKEAKKIITELEKIKDKYIIALDETGKQFSSLELATQIKSPAFQQFNNLIFIIGGPLGLDETVVKQANLKLSLSKMTFTHQMIRVFLLEQIYRSMMINTNRTYHF